MAEDHAAATEDVSAEFECSICMKLLLDPVTVPCGHTFCRTCLEQSLGYRGQCAVCRAPVASGQGVNILIRSIIAERYPRALAQRQRELADELRAEELAAAETRRREVAAPNAGGGATGATAGAGGGQAPILPLLRSKTLSMPYCRGEMDLHSEEELRLLDYALQGGRRLGVVEPGGYHEGARLMGVCVVIEEVQRSRAQPPRVHLLGKFRFWITEPPQVHEDGFELGRCEAFFDEALSTENLVLQADGEEQSQPEGAAVNVPAVARSALELVEQQLVNVGHGGRHAFHGRFGEIPRLRGSHTTSSFMEQLSFWLLGAVVADAAHRRQWLASTDTRGRFEACLAKLQVAGTRSVLDLPGARSWMGPGQSALSSFGLLIAIVLVFVAKALGVFDERRSRGGYRSVQANDEALGDMWAALNFF